MKKLTAGIFTVLMGLVSVNAADAAVASKGYVDSKFFTKEAQAEHVAAQKAIDDAQDAKINKNTADIATLNGDDTVAGSVKKQIKDATATITTAYEAADNALSDRINLLSGGGATKDELNAAIAAEVARADQAYDAKGAAATAQSAAETTAKNYTDAEIAKINSAETGILKQAKDYTDAEVKELADGAVATNTAAIAAINDGTTGILKQAKDYTDGQIDALDLQAISRVPAECGNAGNYCVLTTNGTNFVWEVIVRENTTLDQNDTGLYGDYPATESTVTQ